MEYGYIVEHLNRPSSTLKVYFQDDRLHTTRSSAKLRVIELSMQMGGMPTEWGIRKVPLVQWRLITEPMD